MPPKIPVVSPKRLARALLRHGFFVDRQRGSHMVLRHPDGRTTVVPMHTRDLPIGTLKGILEDIETPIGQLTEML